MGELTANDIVLVKECQSPTGQGAPTMIAQATHTRRSIAPTRQAGATGARRLIAAAMIWGVNNAPRNKLRAQGANGGVRDSG